MDKPIMLNTTTEFEFCDGTKTKLTLAFYYLYKLRSNHKNLYDRYNKIMQETDGKNFDILDMVTVCYVAYMCAHVDEENVMSEEEFMMLCGSDMTVIGKAVKALINPKN